MAELDNAVQGDSDLISGWRVCVGQIVRVTEADRNGLAPQKFLQNIFSIFCFSACLN